MIETHEINRRLAERELVLSRYFRNKRKPIFPLITTVSIKSVHFKRFWNLMEANSSARKLYVVTFSCINILVQPQFQENRIHLNWYRCNHDTFSPSSLKDRLNCIALGISESQPPPLI